MKRFSKFFVLGVTVALLIAMVMPVAAQEGVVEPSAPGEGGTLIESNSGGDANTFNPILTNDSVSSDVTSWMYPTLFGLNDVTLQPEPGATDGLAASWEYDETGTVLTVHIRDDIFWSDGTPITADDYLWAFNAVKSGETSSPRTYVMWSLADGSESGGYVHEVTKLDDKTLQFRLGVVERDEDGEVVLDDAGNPVLKPACDALGEIDDVGVVPAHVYGAVFGEDFASMDADPFFYPETENGSATFGPFNQPFIEFGVQVSLLADQNYPDTYALDYISPGEWIYQNVADSNVEYERFIAGDFSYLGVNANRQNEFRALADETGDFNYTEYPSNGYTYMGFNFADPANPQPGRDEEGNLIDQGLHPLFGDVRVRQAIAYAINVEEMIGTRPDGDTPATGILEGNGYPIATHDHPTLSTTVDELEAAGVVPRAFDPELAMQMLEEAGWTDTDGDGVRECHGCLYATEVDPSYEGSLMQFTLQTNSGNVIRESAGETIRAQLADVGIVVDFSAIEFGSLVDVLLSQTYDAIIIGWSLGSPWSPGGTMGSFFGISSDLPGSGFNTNSYQNPEFDRLVENADALPGCEQDERDALYAQAQQMVYEDQIYVFLFFGNVMFASQGNVANVDPLPNNPLWNITDWVITSD